MTSVGFRPPVLPELWSYLDGMPTMAWSVGPDGSAASLNSRGLAYVGQSGEQAQDWGCNATIYPDDLIRLEEKWRSSLLSGAPPGVDVRIRLDGAYCWL